MDFGCELRLNVWVLSRSAADGGDYSLAAKLRNDCCERTNYAPGTTRPQYEKLLKDFDIPIHL